MILSLRYIPVLAIVLSCGSQKKSVTNTVSFNEPHRPQLHFTPKTGWMNDPNGMVFYKNVYHLFYQHNPDSTVWGPMHWGHATSKDLFHWEHQPIKLFPDSLGTIFSGSAVADVSNTSGFGKDGKVPLVAIFTHHNERGEKAGRNDFQYQSLAYSLDEGATWIKYAGNPVVKNPGIRDFRDPKVSWHEATKKWIMTLATLDRITFYSSPNLKDWTKESEFGKEAGAHGGVWECPDLFPMEYNGELVWVLLVSINPGGPNGGSATQYFTGKFDGKIFTPFDTSTRWIDYGPDNYAGITWSGTGKRKVFLGWMSNWNYANEVPTGKWRSAMTVPRELSLERVGEKYIVSSKPVAEINALAGQPMVIKDIDASNYNLAEKLGSQPGPALLQLSADRIGDLSLVLSNTQGQKVVVGYDKAANHYFIDRSASGKTSFKKGFAAKHTAPRLANSEKMNLTLVIDHSSVEVFADNGLSVMTAIFFPDSILSEYRLQAPAGFTINTLTFTKLRSIYKPTVQAGQ